MKYSLITGATGGIGYEIAKVFAINKHNLILVARNKEKLEQIKNEFEKIYSIAVVVIPMDLSNIDSGKYLYEKTTEDGYIVDNLVNNAGFGDLNGFLDSDWEKQYKMLQLNITTLMEMTYLYGNDMRKAGQGHIMNVASIAAFCAGPNMSNYYATKAYVLSFSEAIAEELKGTGVTVTALCPGPTSTGFEKAAKMDNSKMFTFFKPATAENVARYGYNKMMKGKVVAYYGVISKIMNIGVRLVPRSITRKLAKAINGIPEVK